MRLDKSQSWLERAKSKIPGCAQTFSKSPISFMQGVAPNFLQKAKGAHVWDVDGNRYVDYIMGLGPVILGHADLAVDAAVRAQMEQGMSFSLPHPIEVEVAELLCEFIPCAEMVRFGKNGSDVTAAAVRVTRAYTGREKIACCGYHGWQDWYIGSTSRSRGVPEAVRKLTLTFPYNNIDALSKLFEHNRHEIACVIMEPVSFDPPAPGFLQQVRDVCHAYGALLIFDEVITGFRFACGGAQEYFRVKPDLACFGKAMANGFPLSAIVGRADVMRLFEDVFFSFTHGGEALSLAACRATLQSYRERGVVEHLWRIGKRLQDGANALASKLGLAGVMQCAGLPPFTGFRFLVEDPEQAMLLRSLFLQEVVRRGILANGNHMLSLAHDDGIVDETLCCYQEAMGLVADAVQKGDAAARLEGPPLKPILRQA